jgi:isoquinoline 1-oxidoreductase beta subunit
VPVPENVPLKNASDFKLIGKGTRRLDSRSKCDGSLKFGLDLDLPGMKVALVAHPPIFGGSPKSVDDKAARSIAGVTDVFEIPTISKGTGVVVVSDKFWTAKQARDRLAIDWDFSRIEPADTAHLRAKYKELAGTPGNVAVTRGDLSVLDGIARPTGSMQNTNFPTSRTARWSR